MEAAALPDIINPALILAHARAWIGTPFVPRGDVRGAGADCIGLIRGLNAELTGKRVPAPPWRGDWASAAGEPILGGLAAHVVPVPIIDARPGHIITYRVGKTRAAHVAILTQEGIIHAWEVGGVKETQGLYGREVTSAWALPCAPDCAPGPATLTADECLAVIYRDASGHFAEISHMLTGEVLARTQSHPSRTGVMLTLDPIYNHIETVE